MTWKNTDLRKFLVWVLTFLQEDGGKGSMKRLIVGALALALIYAIVHMVKNIPIAEWTSSLGLIGVIWGFIASLLGLAEYSRIKTTSSDKATEGK